jgi:hypothetical protein
MKDSNWRELCRSAFDFGYIAKLIEHTVDFDTFKTRFQADSDLTEEKWDQLYERYLDGARS